jgi:hypothetical protein
MKKFNFFSILDDVLTKKSGNLDIEKPVEFHKNMSSFMILRYISMDEKYLPYATMMQKYMSVLSPVEMYHWLYKNIPRNRIGYIKYLSKKKKKKVKV